MDEFWKHYALNPNGEVHRYHPARYFGLNLMSLLIHGTLEFRHFNQSLSPLLIMSTIKFIRGLAELVFFADDSFFDSLKQLDVFSEYSTPVYESMIYFLLDGMKENSIENLPNTKEQRALISNLYSTPHHKIYNKSVGTHINGYLLGGEYISTGYFERVDDMPESAGQVDIHNIREQSILE